MPRSLETTLIKKIADAFSSGKLYTPKTDSERRGLKRRVLKGTVATPYKGLYALTEQWVDMEKPQQYKMIIKTSQLGFLLIFSRRAARSRSSLYRDESGSHRRDLQPTYQRFGLSPHEDR